MTVLYSISISLTVAFHKVNIDNRQIKVMLINEISMIEMWFSRCSCESVSNCVLRDGCATHTVTLPTILKTSSVTVHL